MRAKIGQGTKEARNPHIDPGTVRPVYRKELQDGKPRPKAMNTKYSEEDSMPRTPPFQDEASRNSEGARRAVPEAATRDDREDTVEDGRAEHAVPGEYHVQELRPSTGATDTGKVAGLAPKAAKPKSGGPRAADGSQQAPCPKKPKREAPIQGTRGRSSTSLAATETELNTVAGPVPDEKQCTRCSKRQQRAQAEGLSDLQQQPPLKSARLKRRGSNNDGDDESKSRRRGEVAKRQHATAVVNTPVIPSGRTQKRPSASNTRMPAAAATSDKGENVSGKMQHRGRPRGGRHVDAAARPHRQKDATIRPAARCPSRPRWRP